MKVRAKRLGWDEEDDDPDRTPMSELYESMDLEGELEEVVIGPGPNPRKKMFLVDGQEADPTTIEEVK